MTDSGWVAPEQGSELRPTTTPVLGGAGVAVARGDAPMPVDGSVGEDRDDWPLTPLGPVGVAGVLDGGFELLRHGFAPLVTLAAALLLPLQLIDLLVQLQSGVSDGVATGGSPLAALAGIGTQASTLSWVVLAARVIVLSFLGMAAGIMVDDLLVRTRRQGGQLALAAGRRWWVAVLVPVLCLPVKSLGGCLVYVGFFLADALLMCASVVAGAELAGPLHSFARSWRLAWRSYGTALGVAFGGFCISTVLQVALYVGPAALASIFVPSDAVLVVVQQVSLLALLIVQPLTACIAARAYVELRCRSEALDLDLRRHELGLVA